MSTRGSEPTTSKVLGKVLSQNGAVEYADLYQRYLRAPTAEHEGIAKSMAEVLTRVPSKPLFCAELKDLLHGVDTAFLKVLLRHQWHEVRHEHHSHPHNRLAAV
jgi:hypothetical protein